MTAESMLIAMMEDMYPVGETSFALREEGKQKLRRRIDRAIKLKRAVQVTKDLFGLLEMLDDRGGYEALRAVIEITQEKQAVLQRGGADLSELSSYEEILDRLPEAPKPPPRASDAN